MPEGTLRFCLLTTFYPPYNFGGDGIFVRRLANELAERGHSVDVVHCRDAYRFMAGRDPAGAYDDHPNVTVHGLKSRFGFLSPLATQQTGRPFFKASAIRRILVKGFDVIHFHNASLFGPQILEYGSAVKLYTMHEYWLVCPMHTLYRFNREPCASPRCFACALSYRRPPQFWRYTSLMKNAVKHIDAFIAPSRFLKKKHEEMGFDRRIIHLPYFVPQAHDDGSAVENEERYNSDRPYFLFVGRLEKLKGVQTLMAFFRGYPKARLLVAGSGSYEDELRRLAAGSDNIVFLGRRSDKQLRPLYRNATALIVPSLWFENLPLVIMEAFREKTPIIARNLGALREIVEESGGGILFDGEASLRDGLDRLIENTVRRNDLGLLGYQTYLNQWTAEVHMKSYFRLIRDIAATRARSVS